MSQNMIVMFKNAGLSFCYEKMFGKYSVVDEETGKEEISTYDAMNAWTYYIQRVDTIVRRRIAAAEKKRVENYEPTEDDFFGQ